MRFMSRFLSTVIVAGAAVVAAGVVSPDTLAGRSAACAVDGAGACRPSDLQRWLTPAAAGETISAVIEFSGAVAAASQRMNDRLSAVATWESGR